MFSFITPVSFLLIKIISTARKDTSSITDMCGKDFVPYSLGLLWLVELLLRSHSKCFFGGFCACNTKISFLKIPFNPCSPPCAKMGGGFPRLHGIVNLHDRIDE